MFESNSHIADLSMQHYQSYLLKSLCIVVIASIIPQKRVLTFPFIDLASGT